MLGVSAGLWLLNHMGDQPLRLRWMLTVVIAAFIMVESGFTPAALSLLAGAVGPGVGRGVAMGIYSFLLSLGALGGSVLAGIAGRWLAVDGSRTPRSASRWWPSPFCRDWDPYTGSHRRSARCAPRI